MLKREELDNPESCINKAGDEEPVFVLLGRDPAAAIAVRLWAVWARRVGHSIDKIEEAEALATKMDAWPKKVPS